MTGTYLRPAIARISLAGFLIAFCVAFREPMEADPVTHMLVQIPALAWAGWLIADGVSTRTGAEICPELNAGGWAGLSIALFTILFWMLPRSIDDALASPVMEIVKFVTAPLLIGIPLRLSWHRAHPLVRGVLMCNAVSMCGVLAWLYTVAPVRVCNAYLIDDQKRLGLAFLILSFGLAAAWGSRVFFPPRNATAARPAAINPEGRRAL